MKGRGEAQASGFGDDRNWIRFSRARFSATEAERPTARIGKLSADERLQRVAECTSGIFPNRDDFLQQPAVDRLVIDIVAGEGLSAFINCAFLQKKPGLFIFTESNFLAILVLVEVFCGSFAVEFVENGGGHDHVEQGGTHEPSQDDDRDRVQDFFARFSRGKRQRNQGKTGHRGGHADRDEPLKSNLCLFVANEND